MSLTSEPVDADQDPSLAQVVDMRQETRDTREESRRPLLFSSIASKHKPAFSELVGFPMTNKFR